MKTLANFTAIYGPVAGVTTITMGVNRYVRVVGYTNTPDPDTLLSDVIVIMPIGSARRFAEWFVVSFLDHHSDTMDALKLFRDNSNGPIVVLTEEDGVVPYHCWFQDEADAVHVRMMVPTIDTFR